MLRMDVGGLDARRPVNLLARDLVQAPPSLNDDLLDLFGRSEKILSNDFTFPNRWRELPEDVD